MTGPDYSASDGGELNEHIVALVQAEMPLGEGLRAAAAESSNRRVARALEELANAIDAGQSLERAVLSLPRSLPTHVAALLAASKRSGRLREALLDVVEHDVATRETLRTAYAALAYPLALLLFAYGCFLFLQWFVVGNLIEMYREFELDLPPTTALVARLHGMGLWLVIVPVGAVLAAAIILSLMPGSRRQRIVAIVPLFGSLFHWCGVAQATRALGHLVRQNVPLPEALRLSSEGLRDANIAEVWQQLAAEVDAGRSFSQALTATHRVPASIGPLVSWGERSHDLPEALLLSSDMLEGRVRLRAQMIRTVLPPVLFILIGGGAFFLVVAMLGPLITLIQYLSG